MNDFEALYARHARDVFRFAIYLCGDRAKAEDITSEAFVRAWNGSGEIRAATAKTYLFTIARNCYLQSLRQSHRQRPLDEHFPDLATGAQEALESKEELRSVLKALQLLPEVDRTALLLRAQEGLPYEEIGRLLGLSLSAVKTKIFRARAELARMRIPKDLKR